MGPLFYCDDVIGVVVSGFNRGSTLEYPAPYIDRWKSARDYDKLAEAYVNDEWATDVKVEFDKLKAGNPDVIGWIRFDNQDELGINYPILYSGDNQKQHYLRSQYE